MKHIFSKSSQQTQQLNTVFPPLCRMQLAFYWLLVLAHVYFAFGQSAYSTNCATHLSNDDVQLITKREVKQF